MNKRLLLALYDRSGLGAYMPVNYKGNELVVVAHMEKFAELIVKECARIARATPCPYEDDEARQRLGHTWDMASIEAGRGIVKHFGVEE